MITTNERMQFAGNIASSSIYGWANKNARIQTEPNQERLTIFNIDGSMMIADRTQFGASLPLIQKQVTSPQGHFAQTGVGDARFNLGFNLLPEYTYSPLRPKMFGFTQLILPTGISSADSVAPEQVDAIGEGRTSLATGLVILKDFAWFDAYFIPQTLVSVPIRGSNSLSDAFFPLLPIFKTGAIVGLGASWQDFRVGFRVDPIYQYAYSIKAGSSQRMLPPKLTTAFGFEASYMVSRQFAVLAMYFDQDLFGLADRFKTSFNTTVARQMSIGAVYRIPQ
jgi:hypothetical protein